MLPLWEQKYLFNFVKVEKHYCTQCSCKTLGKTWAIRFRATLENLVQ